MKKREILESSKKESFFDVISITLFIAVLVLTTSFYFFLDRTTGSGFGIVEISFSIILSFLITGFLIWDRITIRKNPYLGLIIGLSAPFVFIYGLILRFKGPYTTIFSVAGSSIVLIFIFYYFFKNRNTEKKIENEYDDKP